VTHRPIFIYLAIIVGSLGIALDFASVDLALPALERDFGLDLDSVQWVINGYVLAFSVLMVAGGKFADAYGRRSVFLAGMGLFALSSLLGGLAGSGPTLILCRVIQGVGAALLWPAMIGMACAAVGDDRRSFALGLIFGTCSIGNAAGPVVGGALTQWFSWRWVLWVNVPLALLAMAIAVAAVAKDRREGDAPRNDYPGMVALTGGLVALMVVAYQAQSWGWFDPRTLGCLFAGVGLLAGLFFIERKSTAPLLPADLVGNREIQTLCFCAIAICQLFFVVLLYFTQFAMKFLNEDPVRAGASVVQFMLVYGLVSYFGGPLISFFGSRRLLLLGLVCSAAASVILAIFGPGASSAVFNGSLMLLGFGVGAVIPTLNARAIETAGTARASLVSGITFMCQLSGSALMLAINTAIFSAIAQADFVHRLGAATLTASQQREIDAVISGARTVHALPAGLSDEIRDLSGLLSQSYQAGLQAVLWLGAGLVAVALILVLVAVPRRLAAK